MSNSHIENFVNAVTNKISAVVNNHNSSSNAHSSLLSDYLQTTDVKDNLTSTDTNKPLSAKQGKELKTLVDGKANSTHTHNATQIVDSEIYPNLGNDGSSQWEINQAINGTFGGVFDQLAKKLDKEKDNFITVTDSNIWNYSDYHTKDRWTNEGANGGGITSTTLTSGSQGDGYYVYNFPSNVTEISMEISSSASNCLIVLDTGRQIPISTSPMTFTAISDDGFNISIPNANVTVTYSINSITFNMNTWVDKIYPIGAIYISMVNVAPSTLFGGEWEQIEDTFLLASGNTYNAGSTGGSADAIVVSHNHTQASHTHTTTRNYVGIDSSANWAYGSKVQMSYTSGSRYYPHSDSDTNGITEPNTMTTVTPTINSKGESGTGKNMPPYLAVYVWKRIA